MPYLLVLLALAAQLCPPAGAATADLAWPAVQTQTRPWSYWWWLGSAVDPPNLARELERYRAAGMGGVHIIPIYGARGYESRYVEYLSPRWMELLRYTIGEARRLNLDVDMTTGTGWCFGGPNIGPREASAQAVVRTYDVPPGGTFRERFDASPALSLVAFGPEGKITDLTGRLDAGGRIEWTPAGGAWRVYAVSERPTSKVKRAAPGGEGYMLNPFFGEAMRVYLERFTQAFGRYDGPLPRAMYHDSFEYGVNWSPDLLAEFQKRRGYRLQDEFPAMFGEARDDRAARVKCDYRATISEMMVENVFPQWVNWCRARGIKTRFQAHGSPGNLLDLYALADIPETEMFHLDRSTLVARLASSAAHVAGRGLVSSETGTWLKEHFTETLADLKGLVDQLFLSGVNHVVYHGTAYSPDDAPWPGWLFYASTEMNPRNSIWRDVPALNAYITRVQSVLQSGKPDNDVLLYWPIYDLWHDARGSAMRLTVHDREWLEAQPLGLLAQRLAERGFSYDYVSDRQLTGAAATGAKVRVTGGEYRVLASPRCRLMPLETLRQFLALARSGATVVFDSALPADVPGWGDLDRRRAEFKKLLAGLKLEPLPGAGLKEARIGKGRVLVGDVEAGLKLAGATQESVAYSAGLEFIRRTDAAGRRHYLVVNRREQLVEAWVKLDTPARGIAVMDAMTGETGVARLRGAAEVYLRLEPGQSIILRTSQQAIRGPAWHWRQPDGAGVPIGGTWQVRFLQGGPEMPPPFTATVLGSWTERGGPAQTFAGTALYSARFDAPTGPAASWLIDLGHVAESARVRLNGRDLGTVFMAPFRLPAGRLQPRGNLLEVEVTNLSANRIRDLDIRKVPWKIFHDINFASLDYKQFDASGWPLRPSGLLGPVTVIPCSTN